MNELRGKVAYRNMGRFNMHKKGLSMHNALVLFFSLSVIFSVVGAVLAIKLPKKITAMNEIKAAVIELEENKEEQIKELEKIEEEVGEVSIKLQSLEKDWKEVEEAQSEVKNKQEEVGQAEEVKYAYLTFDDGPSVNTIKILDFLKANNIKATFFVIGKEGYDDVYRRIVDEGHTLAIHSNTHKYSEIYLSVYAFMQDINKLSNKLEKLTGVRPTIMRFPGGSNNTVSYRYGGKDLMDKLTTEVNKAGYQYYDWNVDSSDATEICKNKDAILNSVLNGVVGKEHAMILMHDAAAKTTTVEALPQIVDGLRKKGFILAPITEDTPAVQFK
ncbi:MAG: polysaccharide deacetylase [Cellulosilyticum sp.]|nr:polysaccharide deacetylase [Cellulosilyticum sp.]